MEKVPLVAQLGMTLLPRGRFFCPACGQRLKFSDGYLLCSEGHGSINDSIFDLNQLCPHDRINE